uniref:AP-3 complex subunit delta n=3 Tax=Acrobeloides nanus TaxID=290746 RepID=A0A914C768_9BILA
MALKKVRSNLDRLFDKNLTDLIRGIRNNKENEARYIAACMEEIKVELRQDLTFIKANAVEKLCYLQMLGYDISWAAFNIIEVMASIKYSEKRTGYLTATQCFHDQTDVLMLATNMIRKDLQSAKIYEVGIALSSLSCFVTSDLSRDLVNDVVNLLSSSRPYVRKKAVLLLYKIFLKYPESLRPTFAKLKDKLEDEDPGVQSAAVNVICELARKNPKNYLSLAPVFFKLMSTSSNNWMLIKIIKLFGSLVPLEGRLGKKLLEPLTNLINSTSAMSLLYECINTVIAVLISISSEGPGDHTASIQLCVQKLGVLIEDSDQNLKYLGLLAMGRILQTHPKAVQAHKDIVLNCLEDKDESIRIRALDLLYGMVSKKNIMEIVKKLMDHVDASEGSFYRDELLSRIISICSHNNYQYISNFEWYISVLVELTKVEGTQHGQLIAAQIQDVTVRVQSVRHFSVSQMALLIENAHLLLSGNINQRNNICEVLLAAAWICGEYSEHVRDILSVLEAMLKTKISLVPGSLLSVYIQNIAKLYSVLLLSYEKEDDFDNIESIDNLMLSKLPEFEYADDLEAQERACNLVELVKFVEQRHTTHEKMGEAFALLFEGELNPVAAKAQKRVPVPEGLDLDIWINELEPESEEEQESESEVEEEPKYAENRDTHYKPVEKPEETKKRRTSDVKLDLEEIRRRREFEQENNPYYMKADKKTQEKTSVPLKKRLTNNRTSADPTAMELQSPLEIPGVVGLGSYLKQQESTLSWKDAKSERKKKKLKKGKKGAGKRGKETLSVLSSSEEGEANVIHQINREDGEMPDGALSTDEGEDKNGVDEEFKALDINLDEPLRDDERLFAPKPYARTEQVVHLPSTSRPSIEHGLPQKLENAVNGKTTKKKKREKESKPEKSGEEKKVKPKKKASKKTKKGKEDQHEAYTTLNSSPVDNDVEKSVDSSLIGLTDSISTGYQSTYKDLVENDRVKMKYAINVSDSDCHKVSVGIVIQNKFPHTIRKIEMNILETMNAKLVRSADQEPGSAVLLPFELPGPEISNEHTLHFNFKDINVTQKIRGSMTYFIEQDDGTKHEEKVDFTLHFPCIRFFKFATIGSTSYGIIWSKDELKCSSSEKCTSEKSLKEIVNEINAVANFSVVELVEDEASLYAHDYSDQPVCVLAKKTGPHCQIMIKCMDQNIAQSAVKDLKELIEQNNS